MTDHFPFGSTPPIIDLGEADRNAAMAQRGLHRLRHFAVILDDRSSDIEHDEFDGRLVGAIWLPRSRGARRPGKGRGGGDGFQRSSSGKGHSHLIFRMSWRTGPDKETSAVPMA